MLAVIGRGMSDVAFTSDKIRKQMERMLVAAATPVLTNLGLAGLPDGCEVYPFPIADLFCGNPLIVSGKFHGEFPKSIVVTGLLPDQSTWQLEIPSRKDSKFPLNKVRIEARQCILNTTFLSSHVSDCKLLCGILKLWRLSH